MRFEQLETMRDAGFYVSDISRGLRYRPQLFGAAFAQLLQDVMKGPSPWSEPERELFAAAVSVQRQCPF